MTILQREHSPDYRLLLLLMKSIKNNIGIGDQL